MKYEDRSFPGWLLMKGLDKLIKYGMDTFTLFADEVGIPFTDRNRIIAKAKLITQKPYKEMACPKNLIGERWEYYTKELGYSDLVAREYLRRVDESCENQFIPDPKGIKIANK